MSSNLPGSKAAKYGARVPTAAESLVDVEFGIGRNNVWAFQIIGTLTGTVPVGNCPATRDSISAYVASQKAVLIECSENIETKTLEVVFETLDHKSDVATVVDAQITKTGNEALFALPVAVSAQEWSLEYTIRDTTSKQVYAAGLTFVEYAALAG